MIKRLFATILAVAATFSVAAQQGALMPTAPLKPFTTLYIDAAMEIKLVHIDESEPLRIVYDLGENDYEKFKFTSKQDGVLSVTLVPNTKAMTPASATIYYHSINTLDIKGARVTLDDLNEKMLEIKVNFKGSLSGKITSEDILMSVQSDSFADIKGKCKYLTLDAASRSKVELRSMEITSANLSSSSGGVIAVNAGDRLEVKVGVNSEIKYWGEPNILRVNRAFMGGSLIKQE